MTAIVLAAMFAIVTFCTTIITPVRAQDGSSNPRDYATYTPTACAHAAERTKEYHERDIRMRDTGQFDPVAMQMVDSTVRATAHTCTQPFHVPDVAPRDLPGLITVYAILGDDSAAAAAANRWIAIHAATSEDNRVDALSRVADIYIHWWRFVAVDSVLGQLHAIPTDAARHTEARIYATLAMKSQDLGNDTTARHYAEQVLTIARTLRPKDGKIAPTSSTNRQLLGDVSAAYHVLAADTMEHGGGSAGMHAIINHMTTEFGPTVAQWANLKPLATVLDQPAKPVRAQYWLGATGDTIHPIHGRPALIAFLPRRKDIPVLRRLAARFPDLDITIVRPTQGFFRGDGMLTPTEECERLHEYYFDSLGFHGTVAVEVTDYTYIPDGRRQAQPTPGQRDYADVGGMVVVDPQGIIRRVYGELSGPTEGKVERVIESFERETHMHTLVSAPQP
jgi:hypothetical protein